MRHQPSHRLALVLALASALASCGTPNLSGDPSTGAQLAPQARAEGPAANAPSTQPAAAREETEDDSPAPLPHAVYRKDGFFVSEASSKRGRLLWVFAEGSQDLAEWRRDGELAKSTSLIGAGPAGATLRSGDRDTLLRYLGAKDGFWVDVGHLGRREFLWVFREDSDELREYAANGELGKNVTLIGAGPLGVTLRGGDRETLLEYAGTKPGYVVSLGHIGSREFLWVFEEGSAALDEFRAKGEPAQSVTFVGGGPQGLTLRGADRGTLLLYAARKPGYHVELGRLGNREFVWVFEEGTPELERFLASGDPTQNVTLVGEGPMGATLRGPDRRTLQRYRAL
ncbi:MAG: hypothetical protein R3F34_03680 [Planctomycetota bacterium]